MFVYDLKVDFHGFSLVNVLIRHLSQRIYTDTLKIFYDPLGGDRIGAVWDPSLKQARPFRVFNNFSSIPIAKVSAALILSIAVNDILPLVKGNDKGKDKDKGLIILNESAVLNEIARLGAGLVKN